MNEKKCDVCGALLNLNKDKIYLVKTVNFITKGEVYSDAIDCEKCGCQNILKERRMRVEDGKRLEELTEERIEGEKSRDEMVDVIYKYCRKTKCGECVIPHDEIGCNILGYSDAKAKKAYEKVMKDGRKES